MESSKYDASKPKIASLTHSTTKRDLEKMEQVNSRLETIKIRQEKREKELELLMEDQNNSVNDVENTELSVTELLNIFSKEVKKVTSSQPLDDEFMSKILDHCVSVAKILIQGDFFDLELWNEYFVPFLMSALGEEDAKIASSNIYDVCIEKYAKNDDEDDEDEEGVEYLTNCEFSLGYGAMILLRKAKLKLKRGARYGICGANGCGLCYFL